METQYGIEQPLRLFENRQHQNQNRVGTTEKAFRLYCPLDYILPFQIKRLAGIKDLTSIKLVNNVTQSETEILPNIDTDDLDKLAFENFDYIIHYGQIKHTATITEGDYYLKLTDDTNTWYSEVITFVNFDKDDITNSCIKTKIEYWDKYNVGDIFYRTHQFTNKQYKNVMYLDLTVGRPEWDFEIEGDQDGNGQLIPETLTREKEYLLQGIFPEYFADAITMLPLHLSTNGQIHITTEYGYTTKINRVEVGKPDWVGGDGGNGRLAKMDINFSLVTQIKTNCASSLVPLTSCVRTNFSYETLLLEGSTHYNNGTFLEGLTTRNITHGATVMIEYATGLIDIKTFDSTNDGTPATMYKSAFIVHQKGDVYVNRNLPIGQSEPYLFYGGNSAIGFLSSPVLDFVGPSVGGGGTGAAAGVGLPIVRGKVVTNSIIELWKKQGEGTDTVEVLVGELKTDLLNGSGVAASVFPGETYYLKSIGLNCELGTSNEKTY